jgi:hypothetical protein
MEEKMADEQQHSEAWKEGYEAFKENGFNHYAPDSQNYSDWYAGWLAAKQDAEKYR